MARSLTLIINNTHILEGGTRSSFSFTPQGGIVGSSPDCDWRLLDRLRSVAPRHMRVFVANDRFCLEPSSDAGIVVNRANRPLRPGEPFQVSDGDSIRIGAFDVTAYVEDGEIAQTPRSDRWATKFISVETILNPRAEEDQQKRLLDAALDRPSGRISIEERFRQQTERNDPVAMLARSSETPDQNQVDPVAAFDAEDARRRGPIEIGLNDYLGSTPEAGHRPETPDDHQPTSAYFATPIVKDASMSDAPQETRAHRHAAGPDDLDDYLSKLETRLRDGKSAPALTRREIGVREGWLGHVPAPAGEQATDADLVDHIVLRPLCAALGLPILDMTGPEADRLARDVGQALRAAVDGLMRINRTEEGRSLLAETHIHAIEDNPLRLAETADDAMNDLFLVRSPVHLSAQSAIEESLSMVDHHRRASDVATQAALSAVLSALSPVALARRFLKYKGHAPRTGDLDAWHWTMYQHYYRELASDRQGGLTRMFREVYHQVYDREMRASTETP